MMNTYLRGIGVFSSRVPMNRLSPSVVGGDDVLGEVHRVLGIAEQSPAASTAPLPFWKLGLVLVGGVLLLGAGSALFGRALGAR